MQQQLLLRKLLESSVVDIDHQVSLAGKTYNLSAVVGNAGGSRKEGSIPGGKQVKVAVDQNFSANSVLGHNNSSVEAHSSVQHQYNSDSSKVQDILKSIEDSWAPISEYLEKESAISNAPSPAKVNSTTSNNMLINSAKIDYSQILLPEEVTKLSESFDHSHGTISHAKLLGVMTMEGSPSRSHLLSRLESFLDAKVEDSFSALQRELQFPPAVPGSTSFTHQNNVAASHSPPPPPTVQQLQRMEELDARRGKDALLLNSSLYDNGLSECGETAAGPLHTSAVSPVVRRSNLALHPSLTADAVATTPSVNVKSPTVFTAASPARGSGRGGKESDSVVRPHALAWLVEGLDASASKADKLATAKEIKRLIKYGDDDYWFQHGSPVLYDAAINIR
jgi:hypothetical protein